MSITTDFNNMPILDVDYGASNMAGFSGTYYHDWTIEKYLDSRGFESYDRFVVGKTKIDSAFLKYVIFLIKEQGRIS